MKSIVTLILPAEISSVRLASQTAWRVADLFAKTQKREAVSATYSHAFELCVAEAFTNSVRYTEFPDRPRELTMLFSSGDGTLTVCLCDNNPPFDPFAPPPDIDSYPEKGFGLHLIRQLMDSISYARVNGNNLLSMTKQVGKSL